VSCSSEPDSTERLHQEMVGSLERLAWSILRDWGLAADAVQEAFALLARKTGEVKPADRRGWLVKTVQFQAMNLRRSRSRREQMLGKLLESAGSFSLAVAQVNSVELQEEIDLVRAEVEKLPEEQRRIVKLRLASELSFAQIAEELQLPLGTVLSRMRLALEKLRCRLNEN
jgi:RNA polymerase sigma-70 factor, ECF subfamily